MTRRYLTQEQADRGLSLLGVAPEDFDAVLAAPTHDEAVRLLSGLKERVKQLWKTAALDLHPDKGGDPADFRLAKDVYDLVTGFELRTVP